MDSGERDRAARHHRIYPPSVFRGRRQETSWSEQWGENPPNKLQLCSCCSSCTMPASRVIEHCRRVTLSLSRRSNLKTRLCYYPGFTPRQRRLSEVPTMWWTGWHPMRFPKGSYIHQHLLRSLKLLWVCSFIFFFTSSFHKWIHSKAKYSFQPTYELWVDVTEDKRHSQHKILLPTWLAATHGDCGAFNILHLQGHVCVKLLCREHTNIVSHATVYSTSD